MNKSSNLSSVENALRVLECFTIDETEKRVTEIARELNIAKSTVSRLLKTLLNKGYVKKNQETKKYFLGTKILTLHSSLISHMEIIKEAHPSLEQLARETSESIQLAELEGSNVIYIEQIPSSYPIQIFAHIGRINPIHCTSSGKLLLAYQKEEIIDKILKINFHKYTSSTVTNPNILKEELREIKELGYCFIENQFVEGIASIAAPIKDHNNNVVATVSLVGPVQRINTDKIPRFINKVINTAKKISFNLGFIEKN